MASPPRIDRLLRLRITEGLLRECWLHEEEQALIDRAWSSSPAELAD
jgi:hypothetical protein